MNSRIVSVLALIFLSSAAPLARCATIFQDGFESGALGPQWAVSSTNNGRAAVSADNGPANGTNHLVLDDSVTDAIYSVAEATLTLDLSNKKNVVLSFSAKSLGNEADAPPTGNFTTARNYDGVAISTDGGTTWRAVQSLATVGTTYQNFSITLDSSVTALGGSFRAGFRIRFSQYDNASAPLDGIAIDDVLVTADDDQRTLLELPTPLGEGTGPYTGYVLLAFAPAAPLTLDISTSPTGQVAMPATVTVPAGQTYAPFSFSVNDDALVNLTRSVAVSANATGVTAFPATLTILDNETPPTAALSLPAQVIEGATPTSNASISLSVPATVPITFTLTANPASQVSIPATVTVPAGQTQAIFTIQAVNDTVLDGNIVVTVTASSASLSPTASQTTAVDNEIPALSLSLPVSVIEGATGAGTASMSGTLPSDLTVNLSSSLPSTLTVPATVTIPAGQTSATFSLTTINDTFVNLTRSVTISASGTGVSPTTGTLSVLDDESPPVATLTLPAQLTEGTSPTNNATLSLNVAATVAVTFTLSASPSGELSIPSSVTVPAGQTQVVFTAQAVNDSKIDGDILVTVTASAPSIATVTAQTTAVDNETRTLSLTVPATLQEGSSGTGTLNIPGTLTTALDVSLSNSNPSSLAKPGVVTIPAGQTSATFTMTATDNALRDGSRNVTIGATAATFTGTSRTLIVRDNDVAAYRFATLTDIVNVSSPVSITVSAVDVEGNVISGFTGSVNLSLVLPDGSTQPLTPATALLTGATGWAGSVTLPTVTAPPLRLRATDANGYTGDSNSFDIMRVLPLTTADLVWDGTRGRIYASVPNSAGGTYANQVVAIDPATLQITGSVTTNQDPGRLVITSGAENIYAALNGNGTVAKITASNLTLASTFAVGTSASYGTLYAEDMSAVTGQPNVLIVSRYRKSVSPRHNDVAAFDNGVMRPNLVTDFSGSNVIEPSADPTIFFGFGNEISDFPFHRLQLGANGLTELGITSGLLNSYSIDIRSAGNRVFSTTGVEIDGSQQRILGSFSINTPAPVWPDLAANRVYFIEPQSAYSSSYDKIGAYDPNSFTLIRRLSLPSAQTSPASFIRWGTNGLAFRTASSVVLITSSNLVPSDPPANLAVTVQATPNPATVGSALTYTVRVTNNGPNIANNTQLSAVLSDSQTLQTATSSTGTVTISGSTISVAVGGLASGANATLTITTLPQSAGSLSCTASANSTAVDPDSSDNTGFKLVSVGFQSVQNTVNQLRFTANNLIWDPTRNLLWASVPSTVAAPLGRSIVSIDPTTGLISDPIPINANPVAGCMAISANGRYLYVGLSDSPEVQRFDLSTTPPTGTRLALGLSQWGDPNYAEDIEVLDGDGTSFLVTGSSDHAAMVFDNAVRRTNRTGIYTVDRIERTATPGVFVGYDNYDSGFTLSTLPVTASGVTISASTGSVISGYYADIRGSGNLLLSSTGLLVDSSTRTLKANLGVSGRPCVDGPYQRAYLVNGNGLRAFNTSTGAATGTLTLPTTATGDWALSCIRWGADGFAILGNDGNIYVARWSQAIPAGADINNNGIADAWEALNFGTLNTDPRADSDGDGLADAFEYMFGTSPRTGNTSPVQMMSFLAGGGQASSVHITFPRRSGTSGSYAYEWSTDLKQWTVAQNVTETVLSTQTVGGDVFDTVDAIVTLPAPAASAFARLKWVHP